MWVYLEKKLIIKYKELSIKVEVILITVFIRCTDYSKGK